MLKRNNKNELADSGAEGHIASALDEVARAKGSGRKSGGFMLAVALASTAMAGASQEASAQELRDGIRIARRAVDGYQEDRQMRSRGESIEAQRDQIMREIARTRAELQMFDAYRTGGRIPTEPTYTVTLDGGRTEVQILTGSRELADYRQRMIEARAERARIIAEITADTRMDAEERRQRLALADARLEAVMQGVQESVGERMHYLTQRIADLQEERRRLGVERGGVQFDRVENGLRAAEALARILDN